MIVGSSRKYIGSPSCYVEVICRLLMHRLCRSHTIVDYQEVPQSVYDLGNGEGFAPAGGGKGIGSGGSCSGDGGGSGSGDSGGKGGTIGKGGGKGAQAAQAARGLKRPCPPVVPPPAGTAARSAAAVASAAAAGEDRRAIIHIVKHCLTRGLRPTVISNSNIIDMSFV